MKTKPNNFAMSPEQAAEAAGLGRTLIFEMIRVGKLKAHKCGRRTVILTDDLMECLESLPVVDRRAAP